jgi:hypothetical protein
MVRQRLCRRQNTTGERGTSPECGANCPFFEETPRAWPCAVLLTRLYVAYVLLTRLHVARLFRGGGQRADGLVKIAEAGQSRLHNCPARFSELRFYGIHGQGLQVSQRFLGKFCGQDFQF